MLVGSEDQGSRSSMHSHDKWGRQGFPSVATFMSLACKRLESQHPGPDVCKSYIKAFSLDSAVSWKECHQTS